MTLKWFVNPKRAGCLAAWTLLLSAAPGRAFAFPSESKPAFQAASERTAQIERILEGLSRPEAQVHLRSYGLTQEKLREKLARLDDAQLADVAQKAETVRSAGVLGVIIALLVIAILVVILIWLVDADDKVVVIDKD